MRICIGTKIWKRPEVFRCWARNIERLKADFPRIDFQIVVVGSQQEQSRRLVKPYGFHYLEHENRPLGTKANCMWAKMMQVGADFYVITGSDDIIASQTFERAVMQTATADEIASLSIYFLNPASKELMFARGYEGKREGQPMAPYRMISHELAVKIGADPWNPAKEKNLDGSFWRRLNPIERDKAYYTGGVIVDVKTAENINSMERIKRWSVSSRLPVEPRPVGMLYKYFPKDEIDKILELR